MNRTSWTCFAYAALSLAALSSCKKKANVSHTAYILGPQSQIKSYSSTAPDTAVKASSSVVLILTHLNGGSVKFCTGTLVAPETGSKDVRVLSNHHCFADANHDDTAQDKVLPEACNKTIVYFGFTQEKVTQMGQLNSASCKEGSLRTHFAADLSVFTLKDPVPDDFHPMDIYSGEDFPTGRKALIVHYPDIPENDAVPPGERVKVPTLAYTTDNCSIIGAFSTDEWTLDHSLPFSLRHSCDLVHGSSGSALVDAETHTLIGVNWGGIKVRYDDSVDVSNVATRAVYAKAFLDNNMSVFANPAKPTGKDTQNKGFHDASAAGTSGDSGNAQNKGLCGAFGAKDQGQGLIWFGLPLFLFVRRRR